MKHTLSSSMETVAWSTVVIIHLSVRVMSDMLSLIMKDKVLILSPQ